MDSPISAVAVDSTVKTNRVVSEYVKEKARHQSQPIRERKRPLNILDLPVDILQLIVKEACKYSTMAYCKHLLTQTIRSHIQTT
jgi:predicted RNA-binding protein